MTRTQTTAARDAAPASWGAHGAARGSDSASNKPVDRDSLKGHHKTTLSGVRSG